MLLVLLPALAGDDPPADPGPPTFTPAELAAVLDHSPLPPPPLDPTNKHEQNPRAQRLGQFLFYDTRLSANGAISCATCHLPGRAFTDGLQFSQGIATLQRNAPSLFNLAHNRFYFLDGRADSLWAQVRQPIEAPDEMGSSRLALLKLFHDDPELRAAYEALFGTLPPAPADTSAAMLPAGDWQVVDAFLANVSKSVAAYVRRLVSDRAPFDVWVEGLRDGDPQKLAAISPAAQRGAQLFVSKSCTLCHSGPNFTDMEFHSVRAKLARKELRRDSGRHSGVAKLLDDPFNGAGAFSDSPEAGRAKLDFLVQSEEDIGQFKTPSLRNVALTAPYMHAGQYATLRDVLHHYSEMDDVFDHDPMHFEQMLVPQKFTEQEASDLIAFLESLTDASVDPELLGPPAGP
jgi:cytochrome c peroxidase